MNELRLFEHIRDAYMVSTKNNNVFKKYLESIKWEFKYIADGEYNFGIGDFSFATPSLDPFNMKWEASALFSDGTILSFK